MQRQISVRQYRTADVCIFTALLCLCEALIVLAGTRWFPGELYTLSLTPAITALVMVRWGAWAAAPAAAGGAAFCLFSGAGPAQYLVYCGGNLAALALLPLVRRGGWKRIAGGALPAMVYGMAAALAMQAGRFVIALAMGYAPGVCAGFFTTDVLSALFSVLVIWICRRLGGMLEEQMHYLIRIHEEMNDQSSQAGGINA